MLEITNFIVSYTRHNVSSLFFESFITKNN